MKRITVTCDDTTAKALTELLMDQSFAFSIEPVSENGGMVNTVKPKPKSHKFAEATSNQGLMAILEASGTGAEGENEFTYDAVGKHYVARGLKAQSVSAAISHAKTAGYIAEVAQRTYVLTSKGVKAKAKLLA